jgi:nitrite reductase (NADH) small subunit
MEDFDQIKQFPNSPENIGSLQWFFACLAEDVPDNGGACVRYKDEQIALFYFTRRNEWYATQNECPHRKQMALSRGMIGTQGDEPKVACPFHKKTFSLKTGACLNGDECSLRTYPVKVVDGKVFIGVNPETN